MGSNDNLGVARVNVDSTDRILFHHEIFIFTWVTGLIKLVSQGGSHFSRVCILIFPPENVVYRKLLY